VLDAGFSTASLQQGAGRAVTSPPALKLYSAPLVRVVEGTTAGLTPRSGLTLPSKISTLLGPAGVGGMPPYVLPAPVYTKVLAELGVAWSHTMPRGGPVCRGTTEAGCVLVVVGAGCCQQWRLVVLPWQGGPGAKEESTERADFLLLPGGRGRHSLWSGSSQDAWLA
jgi:hypothetical protein